MEDYFEIRNELLQNNFVFNRTVLKLRKTFRAEKDRLLKKNKYHRKRPEFLEWDKEELFRYYKKGEPLFCKKIADVASYLAIDFSLLFAKVTLNQPTAEKYFVYTVLNPELNPSSTILREGVYIKYIPPMNKDDWRIAEKQAKIAYKNLYNKKIKSRQDIGNENDRKLYKLIERKIKLIFNERQRGVKLNEMDRDSIVLQAIAEALLIDSAELELKRARDNYYEVARRFNLPTLRDLRKLQDIAS